MNSETLKTLPCDQFASGMGEVLKTGLIRNRDFYGWIIEQQAQIELRNPETMDHLIRECCRVKAAVVEEGPLKNGGAGNLEPGPYTRARHRKADEFQMLHGQCVAVGTVGAAYLSYRQGYLTEGRIPSDRPYKSCIPASCVSPGIETGRYPGGNEIRQKKMEEGKIKFVLLKISGSSPGPVGYRSGIT